MGQAELLIAGLLVAVAGLSALARRLSVPYPIVLVVGGALFGFVPGLPVVKLDPQVVLVVFLPPLLYGASIFANFGDLRANLRPLTLSAVGLVLATMCAVAWAAHALIPGLPWEAAFVLGAIVSPTDPLAAATIMRRLDVPRRLVSVLEGEGLFNDATALVAYRVAVAAVVAGSFSLADAGLRFVAGGLGGVAIGLIVGWLIAEVRKRIRDTQLNITVSLLSGYAAFIPADALGRIGSGPRFVIAWAGMRGAVSLAAALAIPLTTDAGTPFPARDLLIFLTFCVIFATLVLQGLTLPAVIRLFRVEGDGSEDREELRARLEATKAALAQLELLGGEEWTRDDTIDRMRRLYEYRKRRFAARAGQIEDDGYEDRSLAYQQLVQAVTLAQRAALVRLRNEGTISNEVMNRVVQEMDLEEARLEI